MRYPRFALVAILSLVLVLAAQSQPQADLALCCVKIGQDDPIFTECPNGEIIPVDAGSTACGDLAGVQKIQSIEEATIRANDGSNLTLSSKAWLRRAD